MPTRRTVLAGFSVLPVLAAIRPAFAQSPDMLATSAGDLTIHPVQHASLALKLGDTVLYIDPAEADFSALPAPSGILITHAHGDHYNAEALEKLAAGGVPLIVNEDVFSKLPESLKAQATALANGATGEIANIPVAAVPAYNTSADRLQYHPQGVGNGYVLSFGDQQVYVAGDTEDVPEMRALTNIALAFLPMNLPYTMAVEQAADAVKAFRPGIVYPYHFGDSDTAKFAELVGDAADVRMASWYPA
jgi:L-ascorbate metabolism protein UlaG (beta-lactamase superfamily)